MLVFIAGAIYCGMGILPMAARPEQLDLADLTIVFP
jgi:hypothetical protein